MAGIENPFEIAISIFPFMDLRNKINPILIKQLDNQCATKYKNLTPIIVRWEIYPTNYIRILMTY